MLSRRDVLRAAGVGAGLLAAPAWPFTRTQRMRPLYLDVTGTTDANGNASIPLKLPVTGEWHDAKLAIGAAQAAEWAILVNGREITFGRGRRVTLGPELIQDGQTVTVSVTAGPPNAQISGTVTGKSGAPQEILAAYTPAPNTIALDTPGAAVVMGTSVKITPPTLTLAVPPGTLAVGYEVLSTITNVAQVTMVGAVTGRTYVSDINIPDGPPRPVLIDPTDTTLTCTVTPANPVFAVSAFDFLAWATPVATRPASSIADATLGPQQIVRNSLGAVGTATLLAGATGQVVRLWGFGFLLGGGAATASRCFLEETAGGGSIAGFDSALGEDSKEGQRNGAPVGGAGDGLQMHVTVLAAGGTIFAWAAVSQG